MYWLTSANERLKNTPFKSKTPLSLEESLSESEVPDFFTGRRGVSKEEEAELPLLTKGIFPIPRGCLEKVVGCGSRGSV